VPVEMTTTVINLLNLLFIMCICFVGAAVIVWGLHGK